MDFFLARLAGILLVVGGLDGVFGQLGQHGVTQGGAGQDLVAGGLDLLGDLRVAIQALLLGGNQKGLFADQVVQQHAGQLLGRDLLHLLLLARRHRLRHGGEVRHADRVAINGGEHRVALRRRRLGGRRGQCGGGQCGHHQGRGGR